MRILIITHDADRHCFFANEIIRQTGQVVAVITGAKKSVRKKPDWRTAKGRRARFQELRNSCANVLFHSSRTALWVERNREETAAFSGQRQHFESKHSSLRMGHVAPEHESVNNPFYVKLVQELKPDLIAVMGACLLKKEILSCAPHVVNMHTGLSPYYRGSYTNLFPIVEGDYGYFGVTIHLMSLGIDSGDILYTAQPRIFADDNYYRVNSRCIQDGVNLMIEAIRRLDGGNAIAVKQWTKGKLFFDRDLNGAVARRYYKQREAFFAKHCCLEQTGQLPKPKLVSQG